MRVLEPGEVVRESARGMTMPAALRAPARAAAAGALSAALYAALGIEETLRPVNDARRDAYVRRWARALLRLLAIEVTVDPSLPRLERSGRARLVAANHRSTVDILLILATFGGQLLARGDMADWPAIGAMARRAGTLFVDRASAVSGAAAVRAMRERLRRGITVCVFPEGTTHQGDEVREFQPGAFLAIARERGEVVPVGIAYERDDAIYGDEPIGGHLRRLLAAPSIRVAVGVGAPIDATGSAVALASAARREVQELVGRARQRFEPRVARATGATGAGKA